MPIAPHQFTKEKLPTTSKLFIITLTDYLATLPFKEALNKKERKYLRGSGEIAKKKKDWKKIEGKWRLVQVIWEVKSGRVGTYWSYLKSYEL